MPFDPLLELFHAALVVAALSLLVLTCVLALELAGALFSSRNPVLAPTEPNCTYAVVIPAHDEVGTIERTLASVSAQISDHGYILVVADNCSDDTAAVAAAAGARVIERHDLERRGKGFALDAAMRALASAPPDVVLIIDADCTPDPGTLPALIAACQHWSKPVQARYELVAPDASAGPVAKIGAFAWQIKNVLRPTGLKALGVPCLLMGTGMAFPWRTLAGVDLASGHLVEDMVLGLDLAARGQGPVYLPEACVRSAFPPSRQGQQSQRERWEAGHLQVVKGWVPRLLWSAIKGADWRLLALALHAAVPPLVLFLLLLSALTSVSGVFALATGRSAAFGLSAIATFISAMIFGVYWLIVGRKILAFREILLLPGYFVTKLSIYGRVLSGRKIEWIRSKRD